MSENPYQAPGAELHASPETATDEGSIESALAGDYDMPIGEIVRDAWQRVKGNKLPFFLAGLINVVVYGGATLAMTFSGLPNGQEAIAEGNVALGMLQSQLGGLLLMPVTVPLGLGTAMFAVRRAGGETPGLGELFAYYGSLPKLLIITIMSTVLVIVGFLFFVLPGIYLSISYAFASILMIDKGLSPWEALETSRKGVTTHFFGVFGTGLVFYLLMILLGVTLVGLLWALPFLMLGLGLVYRRIFGFSSAA